MQSMPPEKSMASLAWPSEAGAGMLQIRRRTLSSSAWTRPSTEASNDASSKGRVRALVGGEARSNEGSVLLMGERDV